MQPAHPTTRPTAIEIRGAGWLLRPPRLSDAEGLYEAVHDSHEVLSQWLSWCGSDYCADHSRQFVSDATNDWTQGAGFPLLAVETTTGKVIGGSGLNFIDWAARRANLGYWTRTSHTRRDLATQWAQHTAVFGLRELHFERLEVVAAEHNVASQRVALKAGATQEGMLRKRIRVHDRWYDGAMFSFVQADLPRLEAAIAQRK